MTIGIDLISNIEKVQKDFFRATNKDIIKATRSALAKSRTTLRKQTVKQIKKRRNMKAGEIKKRMKLTKELNSNNINKLSVSLHMKDQKISMLPFVVGAKTPRKQKGVRVIKRKKISVRIRPTKRKTYPKIFIASGRRRKDGSKGKFQVFRRNPDKKNKIFRQTVPSLHLLVEGKRFRRPVEKIVGIQLQKNFIRAYKFQLSKIK